MKGLLGKEKIKNIQMIIKKLEIDRVLNELKE